MRQTTLIGCFCSFVKLANEMCVVCVWVRACARACELVYVRARACARACGNVKSIRRRISNDIDRSSVGIRCAPHRLTTLRIICGRSRCTHDKICTQEDIHVGCNTVC